MRRGAGGEPNGTGGWPWGGRTAVIWAGEGRPRGREPRGEREMKRETCHFWKSSENGKSDPKKNPTFKIKFTKIPLK